MISGDIRQAEGCLLSCIQNGPDERYAAIAGLLILIYAILGDIAKADAYAENARQKRTITEPSSVRELAVWIEFIQSYRYFVSGDFKKAHAMAVNALDYYRKSDAKLLLPLACLHVALPAYFLKQSEQGCEAAREGLTLLEQFDIRDNQAAWLNYALALNLSGLNRMEDAVVYAEESLKLFQQQSNSWGLATVYDLLHFICLKRKDIPSAEANLATAAAVLEKADLPLTQAIIEIGQLNLLIERRAFDGVAERLKTVEKQAAVSKFYTVKLLLLASRYDLRCNRRNRALEHLTQALSIADACGYAPHLACQSDGMDPLLLELYSKNTFKGCIRQIFNFKGRKGRHALIGYRKSASPGIAAASGEISARLPAQTVPGLKFFLLGKFKLLVGDQVRCLETMGNSKAAMLIKYLAFNRDKGLLHRDELIEVLWPEQDFSKTCKRFNVAVSAVRKFFEPDIKRIHPSLIQKGIQ